jgi:rhamnosyltransferase
VSASTAPPQRTDTLGVVARTVTVIVRAKDEAPAIGRTLDLLAGQRLDGWEQEVLVVDSGSTDGTSDLARERGARVIEIPAATFTFGGSLNTGCAAASGELLVALSAHAFPRDEGWLARMVAALDDPQVACANGQDYDVDGGEMRAPRTQDRALAERNPYWGYSNAAGIFRAELWREHHFREDMPGTEDKEWAWHWLQRGRVVRIDPALNVEHSHAKDPLPEIYERSRREWRGYAMFLDLPRYGVGALLREWWTDKASWRSHARARLSHRRAARLLGKYAGLRGVTR